MRDNTSDLRVQLEEAQKTLALRKEYDQLAEKITSNRLLKPRAEQHSNLEKLNEEIAELERESQDYAQTWSERREQFGKIIEEGMQLRRLIRDEKEEVERREGMEDDGEDGDITSQSKLLFFQLISLQCYIFAIPSKLIIRDIECRQPGSWLH